MLAGYMVATQKTRRAGEQSESGGTIFKGPPLVIHFLEPGSLPEGSMAFKIKIKLKNKNEMKTQACGDISEPNCNIPVSPAFFIFPKMTGKVCFAFLFN